ncbi:hypothetical protein LMH87_006566 [Akanthomyces muscarius]|uniref:Uncharacterized protein n=2 Tax=Akanthomyces TaxID=150366 RepID=A0A168K464_CORDF|nr:hypothetical protein LMH87_006566 [Akanthomyces muscarius]KAJ4164913.1 hypothetical protein LMH87_006566 [Akanthomyces muscarius]OAA81209.1 hypothetical protein LEL_00754 [Akanthomyces lecanii RCEF 1005]
MWSQILRFNLPSDDTISVGTFDDLREAVAQAGALSQYFGYSISMRHKPVPKQRHEISWLIQWPQGPNWDAPLCARFYELVDGEQVADVTVEMNGSNYEDLLSGLDAPVCEVVVLRFKNGTPVLRDNVRESVHKSYTDCFDMLGFVGGDWGFAMNTTLVQGEKLRPRSSNARLAQKDRLLSVYLLGWESIELHEDATKTALFAEELGKLGPHVDSSSGAWYVTLRKHE